MERIKNESFFILILPLIIPFLMVIRGIIVMRDAIKRDIEEKKGNAPVHEFMLPRDMANQKNIEAANTLRGYKLLLWGIIFLFGSIVLEFMALQLTDVSMLLVAGILLVIEIIVNVLIFKTIVPHLE